MGSIFGCMTTYYGSVYSWSDSSFSIDDPVGILSDLSRVVQQRHWIVELKADLLRAFQSKIYLCSFSSDMIICHRLRIGGVVHIYFNVFLKFSAGFCAKGEI